MSKALALYRVTYEVRHRHELGTWHHKTDEIIASSKREVDDKFFEKYNGEYEFRFPVEYTFIDFVEGGGGHVDGDGVRSVSDHQTESVAGSESRSGATDYLPAPNQS